MVRSFSVLSFRFSLSYTRAKSRSWAFLARQLSRSWLRVKDVVIVQGLMLVMHTVRVGLDSLSSLFKPCQRSPKELLHS